MTRLFFICSLAVALQSVYCQQPTQLTESRRAAIRDSVIQMKNQFWDGVRAKHFEATIDLLDNSPEFLWVSPPDTTVFSHDALVAGIKASFQHYRSIDVTIDYIRVEPLTNEYAIFTERSHETDIDTSGKVSKSIGVYTGVAVHRPTGWKLLSGQTYEVPLKNK